MYQSWHTHFCRQRGTRAIQECISLISNAPLQLFSSASTQPFQANYSWTNEPLTLVTYPYVQKHRWAIFQHLVDHLMEYVQQSALRHPALSKLLLFIFWEILYGQSLHSEYFKALHHVMLSMFVKSQTTHPQSLRAQFTTKVLSISTYNQLWHQIRESIFSIPFVLWHHKTLHSTRHRQIRKQLF